MPGPPNDGPPPMVVAMNWVHRITTVAMMMALPAGFGYWLDKRWGTEPGLLIVGAIMGFTLGMIQLLRMTGVWQPKDGNQTNTKS